jgi:hypothetical protein
LEGISITVVWRGGNVLSSGVSFSPASPHADAVLEAIRAVVHVFLRPPFQAGEFQIFFDRAESSL